MSTAAFKLRNITTGGAWSPYADRGFEAAPGDVIEAQLEDTPATDLSSTQFFDTDRSDGRTAVVFTPAGGLAATPTAAVRFTMPSEYGTWEITCRTSGGAAVVDDAGRQDLRPNNKARFVAVRTAVLQLRHPLAGETVEFTAKGLAAALQEAMDALEAGAGGGGASAAPHYLVDALAAINANDIPIRALLSALAFVRLLATSGAAADVLDICRDTGGAGSNGDGAAVRFRLPNAAGTRFTAASISGDIVNVLAVPGPSCDLVLSVTTVAGVLTAALTLLGTGALRLHGSAYAHAGFRLVVDATGNVTASIITPAEVITALSTAATSIAVNAQKITGLANGSAADDAAAFGQIAAAIAAAATSYALAATTMTAGAGMTGGGSLAANRTFDIVAHADGSIVVAADSVQVGVLGYARVLAGLALAAADIDVNAQKITDLANGSASSDAAAFGQIAAAIAAALPAFGAKQLSTNADNATWGATVTLDCSIGMTHRLIANVGVAAACTISASNIVQAALPIQLQIEGAVGCTVAFSSSYFEGAAALNAAFAAAASQRTNYTFGVAVTGKLTPLSVMSGVTIP